MSKNTKTGLSMEELTGQLLVECKRISGKEIQVGEDKRIALQLTVEVLEGDKEGSTCKYGLLSKDAVDNVKKTGRREENGDIIIKLPEPTSTGLEGMNWVR